MPTSATRTIPWVIEQQTAVKHQLLRSYIATWMNILCQQQERLRQPPHLIYVDGFAGPGEYWSTEKRDTKVDGSPILVGKVANELMRGQRKLDIIAFDTDKRTVDHLAPLLAGINTKQQAWEVGHEDFSAGAKGLINKLAGRLGHDYPAFFFIDPFGYSDFPMTLLAEILKHERTEVFITFMTYDIVRFMGKPDAEKKMIQLFGTADYKSYTQSNTPEERVNFVTTLYRRQLLSIAKAKNVIGFRINTPGQEGRARYFLFHASNHIKALKEMKNAMDRTSDQEFKFEAIGVGEGDQLDLFVATPEAQIKAALLGYVERAPKSRVEYSRIEDWGYERTSGVARHIKAALIDLEREDIIKIERKPKQKKNTVVEGAIITFVRNLL
jgi:three-Cys-motif partner protein